METFYSKFIDCIYVNVGDGCKEMNINYRMSETAREYFDRMTYDLTEHDRHDLILDYFDKIQVLLKQDVAWLVEAVQKIDPEEKGMIKRRLERMRKSRDLSNDIDFLVNEYKKGGGRD